MIIDLKQYYTQYIQQFQNENYQLNMAWNYLGGNGSPKK
jgi:hypothetical protein